MCSSDLFSTKSEGFIDKITEATNNQSSITSRDLKANDKFQIIIEKHLSDEDIKIALVFCIHKFHFNDFKNKRHDAIRYDGLSPFLNGINDYLKSI